MSEIMELLGIQLALQQTLASAIGRSSNFFSRNEEVIWIGGSIKDLRQDPRLEERSDRRSTFKEAI